MMRAWWGRMHNVHVYRGGHLKRTGRHADSDSRHGKRVSRGDEH